MTPRAPRPTADDQPTTSVDFINDGRTFSCSVAPRRASESALWWWFRVSSDAGNRYAPFLAESDDTPTSVQARIVAYYDDLLAPRHRRRRRRPAERGTAPAPSAGVRQRRRYFAGSSFTRTFRIHTSLPRLCCWKAKCPFVCVFFSSTKSTVVLPFTLMVMWLPTAVTS
jgi:hypothetical protein